MSAAIRERASRTRSRAPTLDALAEESGSILVFLPGQGEIRRVADIARSARVRDPNVDIAPLYGAMDARAQDRAVAPAPPGRRKIVLATSIAETSLTIEGVRVVVDSGPDARAALRARHRPDAARNGARLARQRRPAARPRRSRRAGRLLPAVGGGGERRACALRRAGDPRRRSLRPSLLDCAVWGVRRSGDARLPRSAAARARSTEARALLASIGALDADGRVTDEGRAIARLALPPRLARMVVDAARAGEARRAAEIAVVLTERGLGGDAVDLDDPARGLPPRPLAARRGRAAAGARDWRQRRARLLPAPRSAARGGARLPCSDPPASGEGERRRSRLPARLRLSRPHRHGARQARRVPDGERPRRGARAARRARRRSLSRDRRDRRPRRRRRASCSPRR